MHLLTLTDFNITFKMLSEKNLRSSFPDVSVNRRADERYKLLNIRVQGGIPSMYKIFKSSLHISDTRNMPQNRAVYHDGEPCTDTQKQTSKVIHALNMRYKTHHKIGIDLLIINSVLFLFLEDDTAINKSK
jgi:hypothetical protein